MIQASYPTDTNPSPMLAQRWAIVCENGPASISSVYSPGLLCLAVHDLSVAVQSQKAVAAYFSRKQLLPVVFAQYASTRWQKRILQLKDKQQ